MAYEPGEGNALSMSVVLMGPSDLTVEWWHQVFTEQCAQFQAAVAGVDLATAVPSEPGWTLRELVLHTASFADQVADYLRTGTRRPLKPRPLPDTDGILGVLAISLETCSRVLRETPAHRPVWTFSPSAPDLAWVWQRAAAHELNLRRWDAQAALRTLTSTDPVQAEDAIDEVLTTLLGAKFGQENSLTLRGRVLVEAGERRWQVELEPGQVPAVAVPSGVVDDGGVDASLSGSAPSVLYQLRGRATLFGSGDRALLRALVVR